jgi:8-oxo-dGTP pyrophosphatase MutT (NUDIX family)
MKVKDLQAKAKLGAGCLIYSLDTNKFLMIQRSEYVPLPLTWSLPGGVVDKDETPADAAIREAMEEIGHHLNEQNLKLIYTNESHAPRFKYYTFASIVKNEFKPALNYECSNYTWCDLDNLPSPLHWGVQQMLNHDKSAELLKEFVDAAKAKLL